MKRQIKFRGKSADGKWHYGDLRQFGRQDKDLNAKVGIYPINDDDWRGCPIVDENTIGQFTGLKDRNGKDIYEGDIIRIDCHPWLDWKELDSVNAEIVMDGFMWSAQWKNPDAGKPVFCAIDIDDVESEYVAEYLGALPNSIEIIGNIHDKIAEQ